MNNKITILKGEKQIQKSIELRLSNKGYKYKILDEEFQDLNLNKSHPYLLIDQYNDLNNQQIFSGLRKHIEKQNKPIFEEFSHYNKNELIDILLNDFIKKWDSATSNVTYYELIFKNEHKYVNLETKDGEKVIRNYNVVSFNNWANNEYTIIKEKRIIGKKGIEQPDFAMYINGIPLIVWEVKTKISTLSKAFKEYSTKETYNKFVLCLGTDGDDVFLTGSNKIYFLWKKYGKNIGANYIFNIQECLMSNKQTLSVREDLQLILNQNVPEENKDVLINIAKRYMPRVKDEQVDFNDIAVVFSRIVEFSPEKRMNLIDEIKKALFVHTTGLEDIIDELFDNPSNLLFYFRFGVMVEKGEPKSGSSDFLINHRVQQYYTLKALDFRLKTARNNEKREGCHLMSEVVKHVQRSGKSITIRSSVNLIAENFSDLFKKVYICVPDLTILNVMKKTFHSNDLKVKRISSRNKFIKSINENSANFTLYLYNIQKTKDPDSVELSEEDFKDTGKYNKNDVLFIIDEVHFSQSKTQAEIRANCFPLSSFLTFTATPKIKEKQGGLVNLTASRYSDSTESGKIFYLDELNSTEAVKMGIILPVVYEKISLSQDASIEDAVEFDKKTKELIKKMLDQDSYKIKIDEEKEKAEIRIRAELEPKLGKDITETIIEEEIFYAKKSIFNKYVELALKEVEKVEKSQALDGLRESKINYVINDMDHKRNTCYSEKENLSFKTKAFFVVETKEEAQRYLKTVRKLSGNDTNYFNGYRFGVDFSETQQSTSDISLISELNGLKNDEEVIRKFESQKEEENPIDILIIVNKYLMGYDNKELVAVYCDKVIKEPAKLYQLITRSATMRLGKRQGFFVDLTFGDDNYRTYTEKCLPYYNNNSGTSISTLKKEEILIQKERLKNKIIDIKELLGYDKNDLLIDEIDIYNRLTSNNKENPDIKEVIKIKVEYFEHFKEINQIMETLINPRYYMENFDEILILSKVNSRYLSEDCPKGQDEILFDRDAIKSIIVKSLSFFGLSDLEEINKFKINSSKVKDTVLQGRIDFNNIVTDFRLSLSFARTSAPKDFARLIGEWSDKILTESDAELTINKFKEKFIEPFEKEQAEIKNEIKNNFDNSVPWYFAYKSMKDAYQLIKDNSESLNKSLASDEDCLDVFCKEYSLTMAKKIKSLLDEEKIADIMSKKYYFEKVNNYVDVDLKNIHEDQNIVRKLWEDSKKLKIILLENESTDENLKDLTNSKEFKQLAIWHLNFMDQYYHELVNKNF